MYYYEYFFRKLSIKVCLTGIKLYTMANLRNKVNCGLIIVNPLKHNADINNAVMLPINESRIISFRAQFIQLTITNMHYFNS